MTAGATTTVDFALARGSNISGTVLRGGVPVSGFPVSIYNAAGSFVQEPRTLPDGTYAASGLSAGTYFARAGSKLYSGISCPLSLVRGVPDDCRIVSGTPIVVAPASTRSGIDFNLDPPGAITGTVTKTGPHAHLEVLVGAFVGDDEAGRTLTLPSGEYHLPIEPGSYTVRTLIEDSRNLINEWYGDVCVGCEGTPAPVVVGAGSVVTGIDFSLEPGGTVSGSVTCRFPPFEPASALTIQVFSNTGKRVRTLRPGDQCGDYVIGGIPTGQYYLLARDVSVIGAGVQPTSGILVDELYGGAVCITKDCDVRRGVPVQVIAGSTTARIDFSLVSGAVSDAFTTAQRLSIFDERGVELESVIRNGIPFVFQQQIAGIPPGIYYAKYGDVLHGGIVCHDCPPTSGRPIIVRPGDATIGPLDFVATAVRHVRGSVTDAAGGAPLSTITVELVSGAGQVVAKATTDMAGRYSVGPIQPGSYYARTWNDRGYVDKTYANQSCATCDPRLGTLVVVGDSADTINIDFTLAVGGIASGSVTTTSGLPLPAVPISLFDGGGTLVARTQSSAAGRFRVTLPAGTYRARAETTKTHGGELYSEIACTSVSCGPASGTPIPVAAGTTTSGINFTLQSCGAMTLSPPLLATGVDGRSYRQILGAAGGVAPIAFDVVGGLLPVGVTLDRANGVLSGVPSLPGRHSFRIAAVAANGCSTENAYVLDVQDCTYQLAPTSATVPAAGGNILVTVHDGCGPLPAIGPSSPFVHVQAGPPTQLSVAIDPNPTAESRIGTAIVGRRVFTVRQAGLASQPPIGFLEVPQEGAPVAGAVAVGGWALDDLEVVRVGIYRDAVGSEPSGLLFLGNAVFIPGARPDVAQAFPALPLSDRAGFGFMILTNMLPNQGNGTFRIHAVAEDAEGTRVTLGSRTIVGANSTSQMPFGTIDTPGQGETIAGTNYLNWGWALTPQPGMIPTDGSTIQILVDGAPIGQVTYNLFRPDVSGGFPGLANSPGPVGYRSIDTTALAEGLHTISWVVSDDRPATSGIGSRYFSVRNSADALPPPFQPIMTTQPATSSGASLPALSSAIADPPAVPVSAPAAPDAGRQAKSLESETLSGAPILLQRNGGPQRLVRADAEPARMLTIAATERLSLVLDASAVERPCGGSWAGYLVKDGELAELPVGASIDPSGTFYWQVGPGFAGRFPLLFIRTDCDGRKHRLPLLVMIENR